VYARRKRRKKMRNTPTAVLVSHTSCDKFSNRDGQSFPREEYGTKNKDPRTQLEKVWLRGEKGIELVTVSGCKQLQSIACLNS